MQRRRPPPAADTGRSCWGSGQQDTSAAQGTKWTLGTATRLSEAARFFPVRLPLWGLKGASSPFPVAGWVESRGREGGVGTPLPASGPAERPARLRWAETSPAAPLRGNGWERTIGNARRAALRINSGKIIFKFGTAERLRTLRCPLFTGGVAEGNSCPIADSQHILCCGTLNKKEPPPRPVTVLSL